MTWIAAHSGQESIAKLLDETDYQRACQAYIWGLPIVGLAAWQKAQREIFKVQDGQLVSFTGFEEKLGIMTPNFGTPYICCIGDLERSGPLVFEVPKGLMAGMIMDFWQRSLSSRSWPTPP